MKKLFILTIVTVCVLMFYMIVFAGDISVSKADSPAMSGTPSVSVDLDLAKAVFEKTCSKCHSLSRPIGKTKDRDGWDRTTRRMSSHHKARFGEPIPEKNRQSIIEYLVANGGK